MVSLLVLAIVIVPITNMAASTLSASNGMRLRAEAADLATQRLAVVAYSAQQGQQLVEGVTSDIESSGNNSFNVSVDVEPVNAATVCTSGGRPQAWSAQATVGWGGGTIAQEIAAGTYVRQSTVIPAPPSQGPAGSGGEIALPVYQAGTSSTLETAAPIVITVTGSCTGASCTTAGQVPSGLVTTESESTGTSGCALFPNLYAGAGWSYTAAVTNSNGYVDNAEHSSGNGSVGASAPALASTIIVTAGTVTTPSTGFFLAPANPVQVQFATQSYGGNGAAPAPAPILPVTVASPGGSALGCSSGECTLGDGATAFNGAGQSALLYPLQVSSGANYQGWAGGPGANPAAFSNGQRIAFASSQGSVTLPVYPLSLTVTEGSTITSVNLTATATDGSGIVTLAPAGSGSGSPRVASSATGIPLGQFQVQTSSGTLSYTGSSGTTSSQLYVWITPTGVCAAGSLMSSACASPSTAPIAVTVS